MITQNEISEIEKRLNESTKGPWRAYIEGRDHESGSDFIMTGDNSEGRNNIELLGAIKPDYDFIANAKQDIPKLIMEIKRLNKLIDTL